MRRHALGPNAIIRNAPALATSLPDRRQRTARSAYRLLSNERTLITAARRPEPDLGVKCIRGRRQAGSRLPVSLRGSPKTG